MYCSNTAGEMQIFAVCTWRIFLWIIWWKNLENRSTFSEVINKCQSGLLFWDTVRKWIICAVVLLLWLNFIYFTDRNFACFRHGQCDGDEKRHGNVRLKCQQDNSPDFKFVSEEPPCHYVRTLFDLWVNICIHVCWSQMALMRMALRTRKSCMPETTTTTIPYADQVIWCDEGPPLAAGSAPCRL